MSPRASTEQEGGIAVEASRPRLKEPPQAAVYLINDDYTPFEFVVEVLEKFFRKNPEEASKITLQVHHLGKGLAGIYPAEIAETKAVQVVEYARAHQHPLLAQAEPL